jgi:D-inositol-3-phosphate glycosyltransferase
MFNQPGNKPLRIAMLSVHTCPLAMLGGKKTGGMNVYVRDLSRALGRLGIQVDVFTRSQDDCVPYVNHDLGFGGRVIHIPAGPEKPIPVAAVSQYIPEFVAGVVNFACEENITYDLIHSHYWLSGLVAEGLRNAWGQHVPIVQMFHTLGHMKNRIATDPCERAPQDRLDGENYIIHHVADRIVAATPAEQAQLRWLYQADLEKVVIIPPGVDLERFRPLPQAVAKEHLGIPVADKNIVFAGRIEPLKGIDTLLLAISLLRERYPEETRNMCVAIIGGDPWADAPDVEMARLQALRHDLGIHDFVTFLGSKDQNELPYYYAAAEAVVMPSHYESFGLVALEAMAMGTPVIASEVGGLAFLVKDGETGFHIPARDHEALAARLFDIINNPDCRHLLGKQAWANARQYDWNRIVRQMVRLYEDALCAPEPALAML